MRVFWGLPTVDRAALVHPTVSIAPPILDDICLPPYAGPVDHDDFTPLMQLAKSLRPALVFEFGTAYGNLTANICSQCTTATVYTVNALAEEQSGDRVTYRLERDEIGRVYRTLGFGSRVVQIYADTLYLDLNKYFSEPVVDLVVIDGCHDSDHVLSDFFKILSFVAPQGVVVFHDTHPSMRRHLWSSYVACMRLRRRGFDIRHLDGTWWAVWKRDWGCPVAGV